MTKGDEPLILAMASLSNVAPEEWRRFVHEMQMHALGTAVQCVSSSPERLPVMQGYAQHAQKLYEMAHSCRETADKIRKPNG